MRPKIPVPCVVSMSSDAANADSTVSGSRHPKNRRTSTPHGMNSTTLNTVCSTAGLRNRAAVLMPAVSRRMSSTNWNGFS
ncbi:hypothetical protein D3C74_417210 [compost metagenome]